jgi:hypothetical protein
MEAANYDPPASSAIAMAQNEDDALTLLLAQRRLYSRAKAAQGARWIGLVVLGVGAPFVSVLWPSLAVVVGAVTGAWLFLGRTGLAWIETRYMARAAAVQEDFDLLIFGMPRVIERTTRPSLEEIALLVHTAGGLREEVEKEHLTDWYPLDPSIPGEQSIAICQRSNASYTERLVRTAVTVWTAATIIWIVLLVVVSVIANLTLATFLLGVLFPVLPAMLDVVEYVRNTWLAANDRADLANTIEGRLRGGEPIAPADLLVWQERMYDLRRGTPQVPDWLYWLTRRRNEAAMRSAARSLGSDSQRPK